MPRPPEGPNAITLATLAAPIFAAHLGHYLATSKDGDAFNTEEVMAGAIEDAWLLWRRAAEATGEDLGA